jgi:hypothetical protein
MRQDKTGEYYVPDECCYYGCNEKGGMMPGLGDDWVDHCFGYKDELDND